MGGVISPSTKSRERYVLRTQNGSSSHSLGGDGDVSELHPLPLIGTHQKNNKIHPAQNEKISTHSASSSTSTASAVSSSSVPGAAVRQQSAPLMLTRTHSANTANSKSLRHQTSSPIIKAPSTHTLTVPASPVKGKFGDKIRCSDTVPWLVKRASLQNQNLADFEFGQVIGRGLMGTVCICKTKTDKYFVLKGVSKQSIVKHNDFRHINNEKDLLKLMNSPFCVKLFGTFQDRKNVYFALELCPGGELFQRLQRKTCFPLDEAKFYVCEVLIALEHVQSLGFVYRDLKPENVMLDEDGHCKLVDFGFSRPCPVDGKMQTLCGTPAYLSPEQLDGKFTQGYTASVDWWSYGVLLYELLVGATPFSQSHNDSHYEIFLRILKKKIHFPWQFDAHAKSLISSLCHPQLEKRLQRVVEIKNSAFFTVSWSGVAARQLVPPHVPRLHRDKVDDRYFRAYSDSSGGSSPGADPLGGVNAGEFADF